MLAIHQPKVLIFDDLRMKLNNQQPFSRITGTQNHKKILYIEAYTLNVSVYTIYITSDLIGNVTHLICGYWQFSFIWLNLRLYYTLVPWFCVIWMFSSDHQMRQLLVPQFIIKINRNGLLLLFIEFNTSNARPKETKDTTKMAPLAYQHPAAALSNTSPVCAKTTD